MAPQPAGNATSTLSGVSRRHPVRHARAHPVLASATNGPTRSVAPSAHAATAGFDTASSGTGVHDGNVALSNRRTVYPNADSDTSQTPSCKATRSPLIKSRAHAAPCNAAGKLVFGTDTLPVTAVPFRFTSTTDARAAAFGRVSQAYSSCHAASVRADRSPLRRHANTPSGAVTLK